MIFKPCYRKNWERSRASCPTVVNCFADQQDKRKSDESQNVASVQPVTVPPRVLNSRGLKNLPWESGFPPSAHSKHQEVWFKNATCQRGCPAPAGQGAGCVHYWMQAWPEVFPLASWLLARPCWAVTYVCCSLLMGLKNERECY